MGDDVVVVAWDDNPLYGDAYDHVYVSACLLIGTWQVSALYRAIRECETEP